MMSSCKALFGRTDNYSILFQELILDLLKIVNDKYLLINLSWKGKALVVCNVMMYEMHCENAMYEHISCSIAVLLN